VCTFNINNQAAGISLSAILSFCSKQPIVTVAYEQKSGQVFHDADSFWVREKKKQVKKRNQILMFAIHRLNGHDCMTRDVVMGKRKNERCVSFVSTMLPKREFMSCLLFGFSELLMKELDKSAVYFWTRRNLFLSLTHCCHILRQ
jgi:hypothetical protein